MPTNPTTEDARTEELTVGVEVEYPESQLGETTYRLAADASHDTYSEVSERHGRNWGLGGDVTSDGSAGLEINSDQREIFGDDAAGWFRDTIQVLENDFAAIFEPTGLMADGNRGTSFGMHIHMSPLSRDQARELYELSQDPLIQLFCCSSLAEDNTDYKVFRSNRYARFDGFDNRRTTAVHACPGRGHYEWRMPEPVTEEHFAKIMEFLHEFHQNGSTAARRYVYSVLKRSPETITAIRRAREIGIEAIEGTQEFEWEGVDVEESLDLAMPFEAYDFYRNVSDSGNRPYAYRVLLDDGNEYIGFYSSSYTADDVFEDNGIQYTTDDVILTEGNAMELVDDPEIVDRVQGAITASRNGQLTRNNNVEKTEATDTLVKEIKKL